MKEKKNCHCYLWVMKKKKKSLSHHKVWNFFFFVTYELWKKSQNHIIKSEKNTIFSSLLLSYEKKKNLKTSLHKVWKSVCYSWVMKKESKLHMKLIKESEKVFITYMWNTKKVKTSHFKVWKSTIFSALLTFQLWKSKNSTL